MSGVGAGRTYGTLAVLSIALLAAAGVGGRSLPARLAEASRLKEAVASVERKSRERASEIAGLDSEIAASEKARAEAEARIRTLETTERGYYVTALDLRADHQYAASTRALEKLLERFPTTALATHANERIRENEGLARDWEKALRERRRARLRRDEAARNAWASPPIPFTGVVDRAALKAERGVRGEVQVWVWAPLPQSTRVWVSLVEERGGRTVGESWAILRDGAGRSGPLGSPQSPLPAGGYVAKIEASFSSPANQSVDAMQKAGTNGENLSGALVQQVLTGQGREKVVRHQASVVVPEATLRMEISAKQGGGQAVSVTGTAALPDGAVVRLRCFSAEGERLTGEIEPASSLQNGAFMGEVGLDRLPGEGAFCEAAFSPADPSQPRAIARAFGRKGERLAGPQVELDPASGLAVLAASAKIG